MKKQIMIAALVAAGLSAQAATVVVSNNITTSTTWSSANDYELRGVIYVEPGRVFSRKEIIAAGHGGNPAISERSVDVQIVTLRRQVDPRGDLIETVRGVGYRMKEE